MQAHLAQASEVKKAIEWILCHLDGHYAADSVAAAIALGAAASETAHETDDQVNSLLQLSVKRNSAKASSIHGKGNDGTTTSTLSRNFRLFTFLLLFQFCLLGFSLFTRNLVSLCKIFPSELMWYRQCLYYKFCSKVVFITFLQAHVGKTSGLF